jgi:hypothetical protein
MRVFDTERELSEALNAVYTKRGYPSDHVVVAQRGGLDGVEMGVRLNWTRK